MRKKLSLFIALCLLNYGCSVFHMDELGKDELGTYEMHHNSCGPKAIRNMLNQIHKDIKWENHSPSQKGISQEIQKTGNLSRFFLGIFHYEAFEITWPCEIENYLNKHNINFKKINKIQDFKDTSKTAIFLVKGSTLKGEWHWITFPTYSLNYIKRVFGEKTQIVLGYVIDER